MILVVDEDRETRRMLRRVLGYCGHCVLCVTGGTDALGIVRTTKPRLVLLDWGTPQGGGSEVLTEIRSDPELSGVPVVIYCTEAGDGRAGFALPAGVQGVLRK